MRQSTLGALDELVRSGKVREIGCSQFSAAQLAEAQCRAIPVPDLTVTVATGKSVAVRSRLAGFSLWPHR